MSVIPQIGKFLILTAPSPSLTCNQQNFPTGDNKSSQYKPYVLSYLLQENLSSGEETV